MQIWFGKDPPRTRETYMQIRRELSLDAAWDQVRVEEELELVVRGELGHRRVRALENEGDPGMGLGDKECGVKEALADRDVVRRVLREKQHSH